MHKFLLIGLIAAATLLVVATPAVRTAAAGAPRLTTHVHAAARAAVTLPQTAATLYSQLDGDSADAVSSQNFETDFDAYDSSITDDFSVPANTTWHIQQLVIPGTFNGNPLGVAAALATLNELSLRTNEIYPHLTALGTRLMKEIRKIAVGKGIPVLLQGPGPVFYMWFTDVPAVSDYRSSARIDRAPYARFAEALLAAGVRVIPGGRWYVSFSHTDADVNRTLEAVSGALDAAAR